MDATVASAHPSQTDDAVHTRAHVHALRSVTGVDTLRAAVADSHSVPYPPGHHTLAVDRIRHPGAWRRKDLGPAASMQ